MIGIIYKATNNINGKSYIGQTIKKLKCRKSIHINSMNNKNIRDTYFYKALNKYGKDNFTWEVLEECNSKEELDEMEFHYIKQYNTFNPNGYNLTYGGEGTWGWIPTEETRQKISKKHIGKKLSEDHKQKIKRCGKDNGMYGRKHTLEVKEKISSMNKGKIAWNKGLTNKTDKRIKSGEENSFFGKKHTLEARQRMSEIAKKRWSDKKKDNDYDQ